MFADLVQGLMMASPASNYSLSDADVKNAIIYKPEYTWSYEAGTHLSLLDNKLTADLAAFYMDTRDQQIVKFAPSGLGRMTVNAGHSASLGAEANVRAIITNALSLNASYGYTHATFKDYRGQVKNQQQQIVSVDYKDNYVPMIPQNTFSLGGEYAFTFQNCFINKLVFNAQYNGVGRIYWTESNDLTQKAYGLLNGKIGITMNKVQVDFWGRNLTDKSYATFGFVSSSNTFMQKGRPMQAGVDLRYRF
jgi:outer membrane receptor protein involved in Fe transport